MDPDPLTDLDEISGARSFEHEPATEYLRRAVVSKNDRE
jgi:hypothetical protein